MRAMGTSLSSASPVASTSVTYDLRRSPPKVLTQLFELLPPSDASLPLASARAALKDIKLDKTSLKSAVRETQSGYSRAIAFRNAIAEVLVLTWLPGQTSPIHDHGDSTCLVRVISGSANERA